MPVARIEDLALYGYCPLKYRYQRVLGLPYREQSSNHLYGETVRGAISRLLYSLSMRSAAQAKEVAMRFFDTTWMRESARCGVKPEVQMERKLDGHLALVEFFERLGGQEKVIGGALETEVAVDTRLSVRGELDGLMIDEEAKKIIIVQVLNDESPIWSMRFQPLQLQWCLEVVKKQLLESTRTRVVHWLFSPFASKKYRLVEAMGNHHEFTAICRALANGIESKVWFPMPHKERCRTCFYTNICSARHCGPVSQEDVQKLKAALE